MKRKSFRVLFFLRKGKLLKNGEAPICMRLTVDGRMYDILIKHNFAITGNDTNKITVIIAFQYECFENLFYWLIQNSRHMRSAQIVLIKLIRNKFV